MSQRRISVPHFLQNLNTIDDYSSSSPTSSSDSHRNSLVVNSNGSLRQRQSSDNRPGSSSTSDDELAIFANTQFFDFDMGCSTDIAATMDDLLMQQEHQLQKSKGFASSSGDLMYNNGASSSSSQYQHQNQISSDILDLTTLQQFSLANELLPLNNNKSIQSSSTESDSLNLNVPTHLNSQHHEFTDPLTLTTQPRLSHIMASPALNSMISHNQTGMSNSSQSHQSLNASQQLQLFIQQQIQAHGKALVPSQQTSSKPSRAQSPTAVSQSSTTTSPHTLKNDSRSSSLIRGSDAVDNDATVPAPPPNSKRRKVSKKAYSETEPSSDSANESKPARKASVSQSAPSDLSLEEDKRRRNTAASARFRVKKKLREQEMERATKDLQDKATTMETRIMQLEMENRWLKNFVVEKNEARNTNELHDLKKKILEEASLSSKVN